MILPVEPKGLELFWPVEIDDGNEKTEENPKKPIIPPAVIYDFFTTYNLDGIRKDLWLWLKHAIENPEMPDDGGISIRDLIFLYEKLNDLVTANYILYHVSLDNNDKPQSDNEENIKP